jgi:acyl CoA:acetate/3-ketoacid CoA transferase beta subunit
LNEINYSGKKQSLYSQRRDKDGYYMKQGYSTFVATFELMPLYSKRKWRVGMGPFQHRRKTPTLLMGKQTITTFTRTLFDSALSFGMIRSQKKLDLTILGIW